MSTIKDPKVATAKAPKGASLAPRRVTRESVIKVRMTADQRRTMEKAARKEGLDLSTWVRMVGLRAAGYGDEKA